MLVSVSGTTLGTARVSSRGVTELEPRAFCGPAADHRSTVITRMTLRMDMAAYERPD